METKYLRIDGLLREVERHGKVELKDAELVLTGRFPRHLLDELRERQDEAMRQLALPRRSPLLDSLDDTPGVPHVALTTTETQDVRGDVALLRRLVASFEAHPGANRIQLRIHQLDGMVKRVQWQGLADHGLRCAVAELLLERAEALGLMVNKRTGRCRRCDGDELAYDVSMRLFCLPCRLTAWRARQDEQQGDHA